MENSYTQRMLDSIDDVCYNRHQGNEQSVAANKAANKENDRAFILKYITDNGTAHLKQIASAMNKQVNQISGRISELKFDGLIEDTGYRRDGCTVYKPKTNWTLF